MTTISEPLPQHPAPTCPPVAYPRVSIRYARVCDMGFADAVEALVQHARKSTYTACVVTPNAQHIVLLEDDLKLRRIYDRAEFVLADGASLLFAARLLGSEIRERIAGVDLFQALCARAASEGFRIFLLGGAPGSAEKTARKLRERHPALQVSGIYVPEPGFENDPAQLEEISSVIRAARPDFLFVGLGAPKQEYWIHERGRQLAVPICMGIGGAFEMVSGTVQRAPKWVQNAGFEWLFRLAIEPGRLWRRYLVGNFKFLTIVFRQLLQSRSTTLQPGEVLK